MGRSKTGKAAIAAAAAAATFVSTLAFAEWLATGSGSGFARARTAVPLSTQNVTVSESLYPGGTGDLTFTAVNGNPYPVTITQVNGVAGSPIVSSSTECNTAGTGVTFTSQTGLALFVGANGTATHTLPGSVAMAADSPSACQGAMFTIPIALVGNSGGSAAPVPSSTTSTTVACSNDTYEPNNSVADQRTLNAMPGTSTAPQTLSTLRLCPNDADWFAFSAQDATVSNCPFNAETFHTRAVVATSPVVAGITVELRSPSSTVVASSSTTSSSGATAESVWTGTCGADNTKTFTVAVSGAVPAAGVTYSLSIYHWES